jgi:thioredoxin-related protein
MKQILYITFALVLILSACSDRNNKQTNKVSEQKEDFQSNEIKDLILSLEKENLTKISRDILQKHIEISREAYNVTIKDETYEFYIVNTEEEIIKAMKDLEMKGLIRSCINCGPIYKRINNIIIVQDPLSKSNAE